jgi:hypothetical protein
MMPMACLVRASGVATPAIDALITWRAMTGRHSLPQRVARMGRGGMDVPRIKRVVDKGVA